jgi:AmpD protein
VTAIRRRAPRLTIDVSGRASRARYIASPNCDDRPAGAEVTLAVVHGISLPPGEFGGDGIERLFTNRLSAAAHPYYAQIAALRVSAHFLIRRDGRLLQFVPVARRAWHAGASNWRGRERCNDFSVGIELEGTDATPYTTAQYAMLARLLKALVRRYPIAHVVGHSDIAPGRKTDPGSAFDWGRLARLLPRARRLREPGRRRAEPRVPAGARRLASSTRQPFANPARRTRRAGS